jgi:hypothetical protein
MPPEVSTFFLQLIAYAGGSAALAFLIFKTLGEKWLDTRFTARLKRVEHGYAVELSKLKHRLDAAANGQNRIHQKEFEVLPEAWYLLDEATSVLKWVTSPLQSYPDVSHLSDSDWAEHLEASEIFSSSDKRYLLGVNQSSRQKEYNEIYDSHKNLRAQQAIRRFQAYAARNSIFLPEDLGAQFDEIRTLMWTASAANSVGREAGDWKLQREGWEKLEKQVEPLFQDIRRAIKRRIAKQMELDVSGLSMPPID